MIINKLFASWNTATYFFWEDAYFHLISWHVKNSSGILQNVTRSHSFSFILTIINQIYPKDAQHYSIIVKLVAKLFS